MDGQKKMALMLKVLKSFGNGFAEGFKLFGLNINKLITSILLSIGYLLGVGTAKLMLGSKSEKKINVSPDHSRKTYYEPLNLSTEKTENYYRQF